MGWARTHRHFLTSGTAAGATGKVDFGARQAPREPHPLAETHALPLKRETETEGGNEKRTKQVPERKVTPAGMSQVSHPPPPPHLPSGCPSIRPESPQTGNWLLCFKYPSQPRYSFSVNLGLSFPHL